MNDDFHNTDDFDQDWSTVDKRTALLQNCYRRLKDEKLFYDALWGRDLHRFLSAGVADSTIQVAIENELIKEPDVERVIVSKLGDEYNIKIKSPLGDIEFSVPTNAP